MSILGILRRSRRARRRRRNVPEHTRRSVVDRERRISRRMTAVRVRVLLPRSIAYKVRRVSYTYPDRVQRAKRHVRVDLGRKKAGFVPAAVSVLVPAVLPEAAPSYVSVREARKGAVRSRSPQLVHHSGRSLRRLMLGTRRRPSEYNRRRYEEVKGRHRMARNGQLASVRRDDAGIVGANYRAGVSAARLADAALVSRALGYS